VKRIHWVEFEDLKWFPSLLRDYQTDVLEATMRRLGLYNQCRPLLDELINTAEDGQVLDLCSGGGGPWPAWSATLPVGTRVVLSDLYPNRRAFQRIAVSHPNIQHFALPLDVCHVPQHLPGTRTLFTALHHLQPQSVQQLLHDCAHQGKPLAAFDFNQRSLLHVALVAVTSGLLCWLLTPTLRPFRWSRLFLTYLVPVIPALVCWDGIVSQLRSYTLEELRGFVQHAQVPGYTWRVGRVGWLGPLGVNYLIGRPSL